VLVDSRLEVPLSARILEGDGVLVAAAAADPARIAALRARGAEVVVLPDAAGKVELAELMRELARRELNEIHVEAGVKLNGSLVAAGVVDELLVYLAPSLLGDGGSGMFNMPSIARLDQQLRLRLVDVQRIGADVRVVARFAR
jgi:diaminohydroxyphosphoribosylaminopyrimidine deaminase/5-amino-6-(5-phosphoribosylamino)uracil reductase